MLEEFKKTIGEWLIPPIFYGTAWKGEQTEPLTLQALNAGFLGIDTANQRKHYFEEGVGRAIEQFLNQNSKSRSDIFLQSKFTYAHGQDERKPYNEREPFSIQVLQSFESSLKHLRTHYLDSYVLHGPYYTEGLTAADWEVWRAMEQLQEKGSVHFLGASNINIEQLRELHQRANVKPHFIQNRCFAVNQWDKDMRSFCQQKGIIYQGFSLLTANSFYFNHPCLAEMQEKYGKSKAQLIFCFALQIGILPLTGTTSQQHMQDDLNLSFKLSDKEVKEIELIAHL